jgi:hypothetical protein
MAGNQYRREIMAINENNGGEKACQWHLRRSEEND